MARRVLSALPALLLLAVLRPAVAWSEATYKRGQTIEVTGTVTDTGNAPVEGITVVLFASHRGYERRSMPRAEEGLVRVPTRTDAQGRFTFEWSWNPYYDTFRVRAEDAAIPAGVSAASGLPEGVAAEADLTRRILDGSPVVVALAVRYAAPSRSDRAARDAPRSDDQSRIYEEMGNPDRVDRLEMPGGDEVAWWYFERGRSYHFRDGRLDQVMEFEPVKGF